jgi:hypothetical protein
MYPFRAVGPDKDIVAGGAIYVGSDADGGRPVVDRAVARYKLCDIDLAYISTTNDGCIVVEASGSMQHD